MKIALGSTSTDKRAILQAALDGRLAYDSIKGVDVDSEITDQPLSVEVTTKGACNRACNAYSATHADLSIGLEGGLDEIDGLYHLICVVAVYDGNEIKTGQSDPLPLPIEVSDQVKQGHQFGQAIRKYATLFPHDESVNELISRHQSFTQAILQVLAALSQR